jgi:hypothetical protein
MMRAELIADARAIEFDTSDLPDLSATPWRRIWLSAREPIYTLVDAAQFPWLSENIWNVSWGSRTPWQKYAKRNIGRDRATLRMHREIMIKVDPRDENFMASHPVDHSNGQTLDNREVNLAWVSKAENLANRHPRASIPPLDQIVRELLAGLPARDVLEEVPF